MAYWKTWQGGWRRCRRLPELGTVEGEDVLEDELAGVGAGFDVEADYVPAFGEEAFGPAA